MTPLQWYQIKLSIAHFVGTDMDALHVLAGVLLQFGVALLLRVPVTRWIPWLSVLGIEMVNEWSDLQAEKWPDRGMQYREAVEDIVLTILLPTLILVVGRLRPRLLVEKEDRKVERGVAEHQDAGTLP